MKRAENGATLLSVAKRCGLDSALPLEQYLPRWISSLQRHRSVGLSGADWLSGRKRRVLELQERIRCSSSPRLTFSSARRAAFPPVRGDTYASSEATPPFVAATPKLGARLRSNDSKRSSFHSRAHLRNVEEHKSSLCPSVSEKKQIMSDDTEKLRSKNQPTFSVEQSSQTVMSPLPRKSDSSSELPIQDFEPDVSVQRDHKMKSRPEFEFDETRIHEKFRLPRIEDFPESALAIRDFLNPQYSLPRRHLLDEWVQGRATIEQKSIRDENGKWTCTLQYVSTQSRNRPVCVIGEDSKQKRSQQAACLHLFAVLFRDGRLGEILPKSEIDFLVDDKKTQAEKSTALNRCFNYAARQDETPIITRGEEDVFLHGLWRRMNRVTISLPKSDILGSALCNTRINAEILAAMRFMDAAKKFPPSDVAVSQENEVCFNDENVSMFFVWLRNCYPSVLIELKQETLSNGLYSTTVFLNQEQLGETAKSSLSNVQASKIALLVAALELCQQHKGLKASFFEELKYGPPIRRQAPLSVRADESNIYLLRQLLSSMRKEGLSDIFEEPKARSLEVSENFATSFDKRTVQFFDDESASVKSDTKMTLQSASVRGRGNYGSQTARSARDKYLLRQQEQFAKAESLKKIRNLQKELPIMKMKDKILQTVNDNAVTILIGETGCGKTTQLPQIFLNEESQKGRGSSCNIICTQPRRIAASAVAHRVATERGESIGNTVGFHVRGVVREAKRLGSINYLTSGIFRQRLLSDPDQVLNSVSHIILDEVHERNADLDVLVTSLRQLIKERQKQGRKTPKVILMSATLDAESFTTYFSRTTDEGSAMQVSAITIPGRAYPVSKSYLDTVLQKIHQTHGQAAFEYLETANDSQRFLRTEQRFAGHSTFLSSPTLNLSSQLDEPDTLVAQDEGSDIVESRPIFLPARLVALIVAYAVKRHGDGAVLVFLPGMADLHEVAACLTEDRPLGVAFDDEAKYNIIRLHSMLHNAQKAVFEESTGGQRKIILSTNVAESSITVPDVHVVIDAGLAKVKLHDSLSRITETRNTWVSKSSADQRAGRAGRVRDGYLYALYTKQRYQSFEAVPLPELLRIDLQGVCLGLIDSDLGVAVRPFFSAVMDAPKEVIVGTAMRRLFAIGAITSDEKVTPLGHLISSLAVHPQLAKMIIMGIIFRCLDSMVVIASLIDSDPLFVVPSPLEREPVRARQWSFAPNSQSDHINTLQAFLELRRIYRSHGRSIAQEYATMNYINWGVFLNMEMSNQAIEQMLIHRGLISIKDKDKEESIQVGGQELNTNSEKAYLIRSLVLTGVSPNLAIRKWTALWRSPNHSKLLAYPSSMLDATKGSLEARQWRKLRRSFKLSTFDGISRSTISKQKYIENGNIVSPWAAFFFSDRLTIEKWPRTNPSKPIGSEAESRVKVDKGLKLGSDNDELEDILDSRGASSGEDLAMDSGDVSLVCDDWLPFNIISDDYYASKIIFEARKALDRMLVQAYKKLDDGEQLVDDPLNMLVSEVVCEALRGDFETLEEADEEERIMVAIRERNRKAVGGVEVDGIIDIEDEDDDYYKLKLL